MKQAQVEYEVFEGVARITGFKNIISFPEIIDIVGEKQAYWYVDNGPHFYLVDSKDYLHSVKKNHPYVRVGNKNMNVSFSIGSKFGKKEMDSIISVMKDAGEIFSNKMSKKIVVNI